MTLAGDEGNHAAGVPVVACPVSGRSVAKEVPRGAAAATAAVPLRGAIYFTRLPSRTGHAAILPWLFPCTLGRAQC